MFKAYVGNLSPSVTEERLESVFRENGISVDSIILKKKYAFIDFPDQVNADRAIDILNGMQLDGMTLQVEPPLSKRGKTNKIVLRNIPVHVASEDVENLVRTCGMVTKCDHGAEGVVYVTYENPDQAQQAVTQLNGQTWNSVTLQVDYASSRMPRRNGRSYDQQNSKPVDVPIRILLKSDYVGAVIGRYGKTIQQITADSGARVDVHRNDHANTQDTAITIKGAPPACSNAIKSIMEIAKREAENGNRGDMPLKILCPNYLCGRIIGRQGRVINGIMESSDAHIVVSNSPDPNNYFVERVVTVSGDVDKISCAEVMLSERMRKAQEKDSEKAQSMGMMMPPGMCQQYGPAMNPGYPSGVGQGYYPPYMGGPGGNWPFNPAMGAGMGAGMPINYPEPVEVSYIYFPEQAVGAMIGTNGTNIKNMMENSNAKMKVLAEEESQAPKSSGGNGDKKEDNRFSTVGLRKMRIVGTHEAQWKAQFFVFKKLREENFILHDDSLFSEVIIPAAVAGRVIGKGGQHFKEMQRVCGGLVRVLDPINETEIPVQILGHFYATQSIQRRIRYLVNTSSQPGTGGGPRMGSGVGILNGGGPGVPYRERRPRREQSR